MDLYIFDNGMQFSERRIYFVADPGYTREQVTALLRLFDGPNKYYTFKILGRVAADWFEGKTLTFETMIDEFVWRLDDWNDAERFEGRKLAAQIPSALLPLLPRFLAENWYAGRSELTENKPGEPITFSMVKEPVDASAKVKPEGEDEP